MHVSKNSMCVVVASELARTNMFERTNVFGNQSGVSLKEMSWMTCRIRTVKSVILLWRMQIFSWGKICLETPLNGCLCHQPLKQSAAARRHYSNVYVCWETPHTLFCLLMMVQTSYGYACSELFLFWSRDLYFGRIQTANNLCMLWYALHSFDEAVGADYCGARALCKLYGVGV